MDRFSPLVFRPIESLINHSIDSSPEAQLSAAALDGQSLDVRIEGTTVLSAYDIFASAGGIDRAAPDQVFNIVVSDGELAIDFIRLSGFDNPKVCAIEVKSAPPPATATASPTSTPPSVTCCRRVAARREAKRYCVCKAVG